MEPSTTRSKKKKGKGSGETRAPIIGRSEMLKREKPEGFIIIDFEAYVDNVPSEVGMTAYPSGDSYHCFTVGRVFSTKERDGMFYVVKKISGIPVNGAPGSRGDYLTIWTEMMAFYEQFGFGWPLFGKAIQLESRILGWIFTRAVAAAELRGEPAPRIPPSVAECEDVLSLLIGGPVLHRETFNVWIGDMTGPLSDFCSFHQQRNSQENSKVRFHCALEDVRAYANALTKALAQIDDVRAVSDKLELLQQQKEEEARLKEEMAKLEVTEFPGILRGRGERPLYVGACPNTTEQCVQITELGVTAVLVDGVAPAVLLEADLAIAEIRVDSGINRLEMARRALADLWSADETVMVCWSTDSRTLKDIWPVLRATLCNRTRKQFDTEFDQIVRLPGARPTYEPPEVGNAWMAVKTFIGALVVCSDFNQGSKQCRPGSQCPRGLGHRCSFCDSLHHTAQRCSLQDAVIRKGLLRFGGDSVVWNNAHSSAYYSVSPQLYLFDVSASLQTSQTAKTLLFPALIRSRYAPLQKRLLAHGWHETGTKDDFYQMWIHAGGPPSQESDSVSANLVQRPVRESDAEFINSKWTYAEGAATLPLVRECCSLRPGEVFEESGKPVAWALTRHDGSIGLVFVDESHRRQGLGSRLVALLTRRLAREYHHTAYVFIDGANKASIEMHRKLGFKYAASEHTWARFTK